MIISFDLDDTLIPGSKSFDTEKQTFAHQLFGLGKIRLGTIELFTQLRNRGHQIYIYTTSFRSISKIRLMFYMYGIPVDVIINQSKHDRYLGTNKTLASKFPPAFKIDIHVDDSAGVRMEGDRYNFRTIIVNEADKNWTRTILTGL